MPRRCERIHENLDRTGYSAVVHHADVACPKDWWDGIPFDRILVDAPCSGFGVIQRHPDIKHHRRPKTLKIGRKNSTKFLSALWPLLNRGGKLIYTTCSILDCENTGLLQRFFAHHSDCVAEKLSAKVGLPRELGINAFRACILATDSFTHASSDVMVVQMQTSRIPS